MYDLGIFYWGQLGNGALGDIYVLTFSDNSTTFVTIEAGSSHTCGIVDDGTIKCWGFNENRQLGIAVDDTTNRTAPTTISGGNRYVKISAGGEHTCALKTSGQMDCWGSDGDGALGNDAVLTDQHIPQTVDASIYTDVLAAEFSSCGLRAGGSLYCWGKNDVGAVGDGTTTNRPTPVAVGLTKKFRPGTIDGWGGVYGVTSDGWGYSWGSDDAGQLGNGVVTGNVLTPTPLLD